MKKIRIAVDAMGGDNAPSSVVEGAVQACRQYKLSIILVGDRQRIEEELRKNNVDSSFPVTVHHATEVIGENESPVSAFRQKKDSSIVVCTQLVKDGRADALVSAGNSGATMAAALMTLGPIPGVIRPAIAVIMPTMNGMSVILDIGANVDCKPQHLVQFAVMGDIYVRHMFRRARPRIGLLSIGREENKGNELVSETHKLLKAARLNFIGNIEGGDIPLSTADVVVCDGFVGNIILKLAEGVSSLILKVFRDEILKRPVRKFVALFFRRVLNSMKKRINYDEYGGAPLLGVNGACIIGHGVSSAKAIKNAIGMASEFVQQDVNEEIRKGIQAQNGIKAGT